MHLLARLLGAQRQHSYYVLAMAVASALALLKLTALAQWLPVEEFGRLSFALALVPPLSFVLGCGLEPFFLRDGSFREGEGRRDALLVLRNQVVSTAALITGAVALLWLAALVGLGVGSLAVLGCEIALVACLTFGFSVTMTYFRIVGRLHTYVNLLVVRQSLAIALAYLAIRLQFSVLLAEVTSYLGMSLAALVLADFRWQKPDRALLLRSLRIGMPLSLSYLLLAASTSGDRWVLPTLISHYDYGLYSFAMIAFTASSGIINFISPVILPRWLKSYGQDQDVSKLFAKLWQFTCLMLLAGAVGCAIALPVCYVALQAFFVKYQAAFPYLCVVVIASAVHMANLWESFFLAIARSTEMLRCNACVLALQLLLYLYGVVGTLTLWHLTLIFLVGRLLALTFLVFRAQQCQHTPQRVDNWPVNTP